MGRYEVNKFMRWVNMDADALADYRRDPAAVVRKWSAVPASGSPRPLPAGGPLTVDEATALSARDFGALYAMGAHPYLLWSFTEAVWIHERPRAWVVESFREAAAEIGYPDFST